MCAKSITERFWSKVEIRGEDDCWLWQGGLNSDGYGNVGKYKGRWYKAHQLCYLLTKGEVSEGLEVCHSCDCRSCCNPKHLWSGTHRQNTDDMTKKNRFASTLGAEDVLRIRNMYVDGSTLTELAVVFGVRFQQISRIVNRVCWKHI